MITQEGRWGMTSITAYTTHSLEYSNAKQTSPQQMKALAVQGFSFFQKSLSLEIQNQTLERKLLLT